MPQLMRQLLKVTLEQWREMKVHGEVHTHVVKPGVTQVCCCIGLRCIIGPLKSPEDEENYTFIFSLAKLGLELNWLLTKAFVYISFCSISCYFFKALYPLLIGKFLLWRIPCRDLFLAPNSQQGAAGVVLWNTLLGLKNELGEEIGLVLPKNVLTHESHYTWLRYAWHCNWSYRMIK